MYLSHPVRHLREDPITGDVELVVELDDADEVTLEDVVADVGGDVVEDLGFDTYRVALPARAVDDLCSGLGDVGVARIETAATLELPVDDDSVKGPDDVE